MAPGFASRLAISALLAAAAPSPSIKAADGRAVPATFSAARGAPARAPAMVIAASAGGRDDWKLAVASLNSAGIATLSIATRAGDASAASGDLTAAAAWLRTQSAIDPEKILFAGNDVRALAALDAGAGDARVAGVAMFASPIASGDVDAQKSLASFGARPLFIAVPAGDKKLAKAALVLDGSALGEHSMLRAPATRGDAGLLSTHGARDEFVAWATRATGLAHAEEPAP